MKRYSLLILGVIASLSISAQNSDFINYQAVIRDGSGSPKISTNVSIFVEIVQGSITGTVSFSETQATSTNAFGLVNLQIGSANPSGFASIDWSNTPYFIRISVDGTMMGTSQLLSVPFALFAKKATEIDPIFLAHPSNSIDNTNISNWNTAFSWGNHAGLYKASSYLPDWAEIANNPFSITSPLNNDLLKYNSTSSKWENWTPNFLTSENQSLTLNTNQLSISGTGGNSVTFTGWDTDKTDDITLSSPTAGDMLYFNGTTWANIPKGTEGQVLMMNASGSPEWQTYFAPPTCSTQAAVFNSPTVTLNGVVNANRLSTTVTFEYGETTSYGNTATATQSPVSGSSNTNVSCDISGLTSGVTYHFRVIATNSLGTTYGDDMTFSFLDIGASWAGGIIFYVDGTGQHGLVAATADQTTSAWGCYLTAIPGADGTAVGTGSQNTTDIISGCATAGIAAKVARAYSGSGYNDWFLPSKDELDLMYINLKSNGYGSFSAVNYWSSSESSSTQVWTQSFNTGIMSLANKTVSYNVRAVRAF